MERDNLFTKGCRLLTVALLVTGCGLSCRAGKIIPVKPGEINRSPEKLSPDKIPVVIEESHGGSFLVFSKLLAPGEEACLINFDMHSDSVGLTGVEGFPLQSYNWIEPLMPEPVSKFIWVIPFSLTQKRGEACLKEVEEKFGRGLYFERAGMDRVTVTDFENLTGKIPADIPLFVSLDLDYWNGQRYWREDLTGVLSWLKQQQNIAGVTVATSLLYHDNQQVAYEILEECFRFFLRENSQNSNRWKISFEPYRTWPEDRSIRGIEYRNEGREIPVLDPEEAPDSLKRLWCENRSKIKVSIEKRRWKKFLKETRQN